LISIIHTHTHTHITHLILSIRILKEYFLPKQITTKMVAVQSGSSSLLNHQSPLYTACGTLKPVRPLPSPNCPWTSKNPSWLFYSGPNPIINGKGTGPQILFYGNIVIACILPHFQQFSALLSKTLKVTNHVYL
jgi:hypothetical protein